MEYKVEELSETEPDHLDEMLRIYDRTYITYEMNGQISIGIKVDNKLIAGINACMTAFKILYISTVFVDENYRRRGLGRMLIQEAEDRAVSLGANMIRLDTFDWQGAAFYKALGYEQVGYYKSEQDGFSEHFFLKRLV